MNLVLLQCDFPPISVRPEHRLRYLRALQDAQSGGGESTFMRLLFERLDAALDEAIDNLREGLV